MISERSSAVAWLALAIALFSVATALRYGRVLASGLDDAIPSMTLSGKWSGFIRADQEWIVWVVSRNARSLVSSPLSFFDAEQCFPEERSLAYGEPAIAMGVLAVPFWIVTGDPIVTYNLVVMLMSLSAALAMYWLVVEWTGLPAAGIMAGLFYSFRGLALNGTVHPYSSDTTWLVLALLFANRWLERGRWRDALPLAVCAAMQMATSFYSMVAALLVAIPFGAERVVRRRAREIRYDQLGLILAVTLATAALIFGPYVQLESSGEFETRRHPLSMPWREHLPGGVAFSGLLPLLLATVGLFAPRKRTLAPNQRELRPGLACGALLAIWVASGEHGLLGIDLLELLTALLPGFGSVRVPLKIDIGAHVVTSVLAGMGAAALVRSFRGRMRLSAEWLGVITAAATVMIGLQRSDRTPLTVKPPQPARGFFAELARLGNDGPLYEIPLLRADVYPAAVAAARRILLSAYHHRPTSACHPSQVPRSQHELEAIYRRLPDRDAFNELARLGFTTIVFHPRNPWHNAVDARRARKKALQLRRLAERADAPIRLLVENRFAHAYELVDAPKQAATPSEGLR